MEILQPYSPGKIQHENRGLWVSQTYDEFLSKKDIDDFKPLLLVSLDKGLW